MSAERTTPYYTNGDLLPVLTLTVFLGVGTGGVNTPEFQSLREAKLVIKNQEMAAPALDSIPEVEQIKSSLKITTVELAKILGVSRQAIYNWKAGGTVKPDNVAKLLNLKAAADILDSADITTTSHLLRRKLAGGKNLFEAIAEGRDGAAMATLLVDMLKEEAEQRRVLAERIPLHKRDRTLGVGLPSLVGKT